MCKSKWKSHQGRAGPIQHSMQCGSIADASGTPEHDTGTLTPHQCNASCKGKCFSSFTCRNYLRSHSAHGLEVGKESNLPLGQGCPSLQGRKVSNGYQCKNSEDLEHDEVQCKTEETNTLGTKFQAQIISTNNSKNRPELKAIHNITKHPQ